MHTIYLSPSNQYANIYAYGNTNEKAECNEIAKYCKESLERNGLIAVIANPQDDMATRCKESDAVHAELHVPIHTNACNKKVMGTRLLCSSRGGAGYNACDCIMKALAPITPGTSDNITVNQKLYEVRVPSAPTAYVECAFHDTVEEAKYIVEHKKEIGEAIAKGICDYFKQSYKAEHNESDTIYRVQAGAFKLKSNAEKIVAQLGQLGYQAFVVEVKQ